MRLGSKKLAEKYVIRHKPMMYLSSRATTDHTSHQQNNYFLFAGNQQNNPRKVVFLTGKTNQPRDRIGQISGPSSAKMTGIRPALLTRLLGPDHPARSEQ
jgi:hypothetical protein